jgi:hypothetical protein
VGATGRQASNTGNSGKAETALVHGKSSVTGVCAQLHWQPWERQQSCLLAGLCCDDGALVDAPAWPEQWPGSETTSACATGHCKPELSCSISSAAIIQFAGLLRMIL